VAVCSGFVEDFWWFAGVAVGLAWCGLAGLGCGVALSLDQSLPQPTRVAYEAHEHELESPMKHGATW
jgi:hypothetical protein